MAYLVLLEAILLLLVCASTQLYTQQTATPLGSHPLLEALMGQQQSAVALVTALLQLIVLRAPQPAELTLFKPATEGGTGVMRLVRTAAGEVRAPPTTSQTCMLLIGKPVSCPCLAAAEVQAARASLLSYSWW